MEKKGKGRIMLETKFHQLTQKKRADQERGILLHFSSLATPFGIGDLGSSAYQFADYLHQHQQRYWQVLPLNYCGYGNSPYNPLSSFAAFPYLISPELLYQKGWLSKAELQAAYLPEASIVDYEAVYCNKDQLFAAAIPRYLAERDITIFIDSHSQDLKPFMAFITLMQLYNNSAWYLWNPEHKQYSDHLYLDLMQKYPQMMQYAAALQAIFWEQFGELKQYLKEKNIALIGDMPLYVAYESADVWANQQYFALDDNGNRTLVAGVPPDAFSSDGQLWGNPVYNWQKLQSDSYHWFNRRIGNALKYYDHLRLDHFIGFVNYWEIEAAEETAINGKWVQAPAEDYFDQLIQIYPKESFIAEDLGILTQQVCEIRDKYSFPGMIILQFCFDERIPDIAAFPADKIIYTGTHDNDTSLGWYENYICQHPQSREHLLAYLLQNAYIQSAEDLSAKNISHLLIRIGYDSPCRIVIVPMQDILSLDTAARMNIPGTATGNWTWKMLSGDLLK